MKLEAAIGKGGRVTYRLTQGNRVWLLRSTCIGYEDSLDSLDWAAARNKVLICGIRLGSVVRDRI